MVGLGEAHGCRTVALGTAMDRPLGVACGNALEVAEAIAGLGGRGPADLMEVTRALAVEMLLVSGVEHDPQAARSTLEETIRSGRALERFRQVVEAQGGDPRVVDDPGRLPVAPVREELPAPADGIIQEIPPRPLGHAIIALGGGRARTDDWIDPSVGLEIPVKPGQRVARGDLLAVIHARTREDAEAARRSLLSAIRIAEAMPEPLPLISYRLSAEGFEPR
jgi:pyrimidine-nucleoside phosphorylase